MHNEKGFWPAEKTWCPIECLQDFYRGDAMGHSSNISLLRVDSHPTVVLVDKLAAMVWWCRIHHLHLPAGIMEMAGISDQCCKAVGAEGDLRHLQSHTRLMSGTTQVSRYQKGKNQSGFYWSKRQWVAVASAGTYASLHAPCCRQITMPALHHSVFYRPDGLHAAQPTASKHWRHKLQKRKQKSQIANIISALLNLILPKFQLVLYPWLLFHLQSKHHA